MDITCIPLMTGFDSHYQVVPIHYAISFPYVACRDLTLNAESIGAEDYSHFYTIDDMDGDVVEVFKEVIDTRKVIDAYNR